MKILPKVFCLMGPTAVGKTEVAIAWAERYPCDIISVDSALVYRGMDIGTAKPDAASLAKAPHQLIDIREPHQAYSAADFCHDASVAIAATLAKQRIPLLVGGTMLYFRALQQGLSNLPAADARIREQLSEEILQQGIEQMHQQLHNVDPIIAAKIKPTDTQRVQRALEVYRLTGQPMSQLQQQEKVSSPYQFFNLAIMPTERQALHQRIEQRFHRMLASGFIEEVEKLRARDNLNLSMSSMRAVGYRQVWEYLDGKYDKAEMIAKGIAATRQLAKRQITWLRRWPALNTFADYESLLAATSLLMDVLR
jgi:tRNA dimethylallyltransferase